MTQQEFSYETKRLEDLYNKELNDTQMRFWYESLNKYTLKQYQTGVGEYAKKNKYMPTIADMIDAIEYGKRLVADREREEVEVFPCDKCKGTGYLFYKKMINGFPFEYACQCTCKNGNKVAYDGRNCKGKDKTDYYLRNARDVMIGGEIDG